MQLDAVKKGRDRAPTITAVVTVCSCSRPLTITVTMGTDKSSSCFCGQKFMAGWGVDGFLTVYRASNGRKG